MPPPELSSIDESAVPGYVRVMRAYAIEPRGRAAQRKSKMLRKQTLLVLTLGGLLASPGVFAAESAPDPSATSGFYGGVSVRDAGAETRGIHFGHLSSAWGRFASPVTDDPATRRTLAFGGYRFSNDVAVEGSLTTSESYALRPFDTTVRRGVGLSLVATPPDLANHSYNADVYTSWSLRNSLSLYGRLGYARSDTPPAYALAALAPGDARRFRDGVNYGVGVRYDVTPALGLRLEYARFPRFAGEGTPGVLPDSDQVQFGMQFRF
jgi:opacity protein-like surface antigen